jgi:putative transposase
MLAVIRLGESNANDYIESFNGTFRDECLNEHWFITMILARELIEKGRIEYNTDRTHSSLGDPTQAEFAEECLARKKKDVLSTVDSTPGPY